MSSICEQLARFRGRVLRREMLVRRGYPLAIVRYRIPHDVRLIDLDDPQTLKREVLRPSQVATRDRPVTQQTAARLYTDHPNAAGLRWWSTLEASWINVTLFAERVMGVVNANQPRPLTTEEPDVQAAARLLGLA